MPKVKVARKSTWVDMTAMTDVAFLLLTFFMLTSNFVKKEPVLVYTPSSISEIKIPETNIMTVLLDKNGKIFFGIDGQTTRRDLITRMGEKFSVSFTEEEIRQFTLIDLAGNPMGAMKTYLGMGMEQRENPDNNLGVPADSTDNQLRAWVKTARELNKDARIAIKADEKTPYPTIKKVMKTLQQIDENRYNLITRLEGPSDEAPKK
ncbi:MAG: biopolymer transporter ExbD [Bacteroidales bacterium]|nr:biopolymer transporter ExbD [Bacteroidales bacterium]